MAKAKKTGENLESELRSSPKEAYAALQSLVTAIAPPYVLRVDGLIAEQSGQSAPIGYAASRDEYERNLDTAGRNLGGITAFVVQNIMENPEPKQREQSVSKWLTVQNQAYKDGDLLTFSVLNQALQSCPDEFIKAKDKKRLAEYGALTHAQLTKHSKKSKKSIPSIDMLKDELKALDHPGIGDDNNLKISILENVNSAHKGGRPAGSLSLQERDVQAFSQTHPALIDVRREYMSYSDEARINLLAEAFATDPLQNFEFPERNLYQTGLDVIELFKAHAGEAPVFTRDNFEKFKASDFGDMFEDEFFEEIEAIYENPNQSAFVSEAYEQKPENVGEKFNTLAAIYASQVPLDVFDLPQPMEILNIELAAKIYQTTDLDTVAGTITELREGLIQGINEIPLQNLESIFQDNDNLNSQDKRVMLMMLTDVIPSESLPEELRENATALLTDEQTDIDAVISKLSDVVSTSDPEQITQALEHQSQALSDVTARYSEELAKKLQAGESLGSVALKDIEKERLNVGNPNDLIVNYVKQDVLSQATPEDRVKCLEDWVAVAHDAMQEGHSEILFSVNFAITTRIIPNEFGGEMKQLSSEHQQMLEQITKLCSGEKTAFANYLDRHDSPRPFITYILNDVTNLFENPQPSAIAKDILTRKILEPTKDKALRRDENYSLPESATSLEALNTEFLTKAGEYQESAGYEKIMQQRVDEMMAVDDALSSVMLLEASKRYLMARNDRDLKPTCLALKKKINKLDAQSCKQMLATLSANNDMAESSGDRQRRVKAIYSQYAELEKAFKAQLVDRLVEGADTPFQVQGTEIMTGTASKKDAKNTVNIVLDGFAKYQNEGAPFTQENFEQFKAVPWVAKALEKNDYLAQKANAVDFQEIDLMAEIGAPDAANLAESKAQSIQAKAPDDPQPVSVADIIAEHQAHVIAELDGNDAAAEQAISNLQAMLEQAPPDVLADNRTVVISTGIQNIVKDQQYIQQASTIEQDFKAYNHALSDYHKNKSPENKEALIDTYKTLLEKAELPRYKGDEQVQDRLHEIDLKLSKTAAKRAKYGVEEAVSYSGKQIQSAWDQYELRREMTGAGDKMTKNLYMDLKNKIEHASDEAKGDPDVQKVVKGFNAVREKYHEQWQKETSHKGDKDFQQITFKR